MLGEMAAPLIFSGLFGLFEEFIIVIVYMLAVFMKKTSREPIDEVERLEVY